MPSCQAFMMKDKEIQHLVSFLCVRHALYLVWGYSDGQDIKELTLIELMI